jgi:hypothetical protein
MTDQLTPEQIQANLLTLLGQVHPTLAQPQADSQPQMDLQQLAQLLAQQLPGSRTVLRDRGPRAMATAVAIVEENRDGDPVPMYKFYAEEIVDKYGGEAGLIDALEDAGIPVKAWSSNYGKRSRGRGRRR